MDGCFLFLQGKIDITPWILNINKLNKYLYMLLKMEEGEWGN